MFWVYILKRCDGKYYIGQTNNLNARYSRHATGQVKSTKAFRPLELMYSEVFESRTDSVNREKQLKSLKSHDAVTKLLATNGLVV